MQETGEVLVLQWVRRRPEVKTPQREGYGATLFANFWRSSWTARSIFGIRPRG